MRYTLSLLSSVALAAAMNGAASEAQEKATFNLQVSRDASDLTRVQAQLDVNGTLKTTAAGQQKSSNVKVSASLTYDERRLAAKGDSRLSLRHYDRAEASIRVDQGEFRPRLRQARKLLAVNVQTDRAVLSSPNGPLTREELDLLDIPGNTAVLPLLLPDNPVAAGGSWKPHGDALAILLCIDAVSASDVECVLSQVTPERIAQVQLSGHVNGAVHGVATEIELKGRFEFDLRARRFTELELTINEDRGISHIGPGLKVKCELKLNIDGIASSAQLAEDRVAKLAEAAPPSDPLLLFQWQSTGYHLLHSRLWHVVDERPHLAVLRLIERGELVAQCNISPGHASTPLQGGAKQGNAAAGAAQAPTAAKPKTLDEYSEQVRKALDKNFGKIVSTQQRTTAAGLKSFCVVAEGEVKDVPIRWVYYLLSDNAGRHAGLVFTLDQKLTAKFGTAGEKLVDQFRFDGGPQKNAPAKQTKAAAKPVAPRAKR